MRIGEYAALLPKALADNLQLLVVGPPGIGKTQVPEDYARAAGWQCRAICMPMADPPFLMGYPYRENGHAGHAPFGVLAEALAATEPFLLILDEFGGASETTLKAGLRLMQFREVAGRRLSECVRVIALSNDVGHGAGVLGIIEPMKGRFDTIITVEPHVDDTVNYGLGRGWPAWLLGFLRNCPEALSDYKPLKSMQVGGSDPRAWEKVAKLDLAGYLDRPEGREMVIGRVGKGHGAAAMAFRDLQSSLPDIDGVLLNPETAEIPKKPDCRWLVTMALASRITHDNLGRALKYLNRLPGLYETLAMLGAKGKEDYQRANNLLAKGYRSFCSSREFIAWSVTERAKAIQGA